MCFIYIPVGAIIGWKIFNDGGWLAINHATLFILIFSIGASLFRKAPERKFLGVTLFVIQLVLFFAVNATKNSPMGIVLTFALTGFLGFTIGPILNFYISTFSNGSELIMMALGSTALIFFGLSAIALNPNRNFSKIWRFLKRTSGKYSHNTLQIKYIDSVNYTMKSPDCLPWNYHISRSYCISVVWNISAPVGESSDQPFHPLKRRNKMQSSLKSNH